ncbi:MAG: L-lactate permease [Clostridia bacterium]
MVDLLFSIVPILVILALLLIWRQPADITGVIGWAAVALVALFAFNTSIEVITRSTASGLIKSLPVSLIVATSLLQMALLQTTGALKRIIVFIKSISSENRSVQIMMISIGFGTLMVAVGATPVSILPPILLALGYSAYTSIALPAIGYDALCTYALLGAPVVVFVDTVNKVFNKVGPEAYTLSQVGSIFWLFIPVVSTLIGFCMLWLVGRWKGVKDGFVPCITTGVVISVVSYFTNKVDNLVPLTGVICGVAVIVTMALYLKITGKKIFERQHLTPDDIACEKTMPLWKSLMPWGLLIAIVLILNLPQDIFKILYRDLLFPIKGLAVGPETTPVANDINTRWLWNAYTWIFVSTILAIPFIVTKKSQITDAVKVWLKRAPRPVFAAAIFFAIGEIMGTSGFDMATKTFVKPSMVEILATNSANFFGSLYSLVAPFIGLLGGFITGSEASTIGMFGKYALKTASNLAFSPNIIILIAATVAFGGGLASVISPAKLQNAAASIDKMGEENKVIRVAFVFSIILTVVTALFAFAYVTLKVV